jgi:hypothetical protein
MSAVSHKNQFPLLNVWWMNHVYFLLLLQLVLLAEQPGWYVD